MCLIPRLRRPCDDLADLGPDRRLQLDRPAELVVDADHDHRVAFAVRLVERLADLRRQLDPLHLHEPLAADADGVPLDVDGDPVADLVLGVVDRRQRRGPAPRPCGGSPGRSGGGTSARRRRRTGGSAPRVKPSRGDDPADLGPLAGQGAGLVEQDGVDLVHQLEGPAVLDQDALVGAEGQRARASPAARPSGCRCRSRC